MTGLGEYSIALGVISPLFILFSLSLKQRFFSGELSGESSTRQDIFYLRTLFFLFSCAVFIIALFFGYTYLTIAILVKLIEFSIDDTLVFLKGRLFFKNILALSFSYSALIYVIVSNSDLLGVPFLVMLFAMYNLLSLCSLKKPSNAIGSLIKGFKISSILLAQNLTVIGQRYVVSVQMGIEAVGLFTIITNLVVIASIVFQSIYIQSKGFVRDNLIVICGAFLIAMSIPASLYFNDIIYFVFTVSIDNRISNIVLALSFLVCIDFYMVIQAVGAGKRLSFIPNIVSFCVFSALIFIGARDIFSLCLILMLGYLVRIYFNFVNFRKV